MASSVYDQVQKQRYRVTLELDVLNDFNPRDINWNKLFELSETECCEAYIEDLDAVVW
jgi:hypothetical protein